MTETWKESVMESLLSFNCAPENFIPGCFADSNATGPAINKYRGMIEPQNTPFKPNGHGLGPIKRLWMFLVRQECIQNFFIKFIFGRKAKPVNFRYVEKKLKPTFLFVIELRKKMHFFTGV